MKNKGRTQMASNGNCKGDLFWITRMITSMGSRRTEFGNFQGVSMRYTKKKWSKRVRGYFKSQTKDLLNGD